MPIVQRTPPQAGPVNGRAVAKVESHIAVATAANRFIVVDATTLGREVQIGERLSLKFSHGSAAIETDRDRGR
jgi:hypothetical protein